MTRQVLVALALALMVSGCFRALSAPEYLSQKKIGYPREAVFTVCHGYDCSYRTAVRLDATSWSRVRAQFTPAATSPADERDRIIGAVSLLEATVGRRIGAADDIAGHAGILAGDPSQLDCIDESVNTTVYLILLRDAGLLRWHVPSKPAFRGVFVDFRWNHQTAVLKEKRTGREFALDTWFRRNGQRAYLIHLEDWQWGFGLPRYSLTRL